MKKISHLAISLIVGLVLVTMLGCSAPPVAKRRYLYPAPPNQPRVEWMGTYVSENDFPKEGLAKLVRDIAGEADADSFDGPVGVTVNSKGLVLVSDLYLQTILGVDVERGDIFPLRPGLHFRNNLGIAVDRQDRIFIADGRARNVTVLSPSGEALYVFGDEKVFGKPTHLAVNDALGRLYVTDVDENKIKVFTLDGQSLFAFGGPGAGEGEFNVPQGLAVDRDGRVFVADMLNARIQVFDADGKFLYKFGGRGVGRNQFETPKGVAFDSEGHLYVIDSRRGNYRIFQPDGTLLLEVGAESIKETSLLGLTLSTAIAIDSRDRIFVLDLMNRRMALWQYLSAQYLRDHPL